MAITYEEAIALDPNTGQVNMDLFKQYADQQATSLANMRANTQLSAPLQTLQANPELLNQATSYVSSQGVAPGSDFQAQVENFAVQSPERQYLMTNRTGLEIIYQLQSLRKTLRDSIIMARHLLQILGYKITDTVSIWSYRMLILT